MRAETFQVKVIIEYKYGTIFRSVIESTQMEWCNEMSGTIINPIARTVFDVLNDTIPVIFHKCPFSVSLRNLLQHQLFQHHQEN